MVGQALQRPLLFEQMAHTTSVELLPASPSGNISLMAFLCMILSLVVGIAFVGLVLGAMRAYIAILNQHSYPSGHGRLGKR